MTVKNRFDLSLNAAESYARDKVPSLFGPLAQATLDGLELPEGIDALDVACGPGVMARALSAHLRSPGRIVGVDMSPAMIEVARRDAPELEWVVAPADALPFEVDTFDLVSCQQGLQFFPDRQRALAEMRRVMRSGGRLVVSVWGGAPPFREFCARHLRRRLGESAARTALAPFSFGDAADMTALLEQAGFEAGAPREIDVPRRMPATTAAMRDDLLATPNEPALRAAGDGVIEAISRAILADLDAFREGDRLVLPQTSRVFEATAP